ncbi:hypothetical protein F2Q69_00002052 [Brassica cretica]|uniref:Uncharacterized protein n=1 Tax=Brassica cretica TaxID=69181 RepID=A0A8S9P2T7_BRACR|nr:hypothetical protein F2Q69_00002052 [Brassica cretica]
MRCETSHRDGQYGGERRNADGCCVFGEAFMEENDGTQTAAASLVKLSSAASPVKLSAAASPVKFSVFVSLVKLLYLCL